MTAEIASAPGIVAQPVVARQTQERRKLSIGRQAFLQLLCLLVTATVIFPVLWILSMSVDPRNLARPDGLNLIPPGWTFDAYTKVINQPTLNPVSFWQLAANSLFIAAFISLCSVTLGVLAAYAFSRLQFRGRGVLMIAVLAVLMLPAVATLAPLFVSLNKIQIGQFNLRASLLGVSLAVTSGTLPFAIWNLKGYLDTIPRELEEAATVDGASKFRIFWHIILPLSKPVLAVTAFFGFLAGWTEFYFSFVFLTDVHQWTLAMALNGMVGQYAGSTPWSQFAAFSILVALPVVVVYFILQRWFVAGLTVGGVKG
jgi:arabinogalactan oligomer / maltooligosaccharide transport system permease protein